MVCKVHFTNHFVFSLSQYLSPKVPPSLQLTVGTGWQQKMMVGWEALVGTKYNDVP
jgi:hypothetical protein